MAKGSTGVNTSTMIHVKKPDKIQCDCRRCYHSKRSGDTLYCSFYDIFSPARQSCARYWCVKPAPKQKKAKSKKK